MNILSPTKISFSMKKKIPYNGLRWTARISGTLFVAFTLFFVIASFIDSMNRNNGSPLASLSTLVIIIFIIWSIALAGLILALWKEGIGGVISLGSFILMYILNLFNTEAPIRAGAFPVFLIFSIPSILYLSYWKFTGGTFRHKEKFEPENSVRT
jgi:uncharacterized membrane protein